MTKNIHINTDIQSRVPVNRRFRFATPIIVFLLCLCYTGSIFGQANVVITDPVTGKADVTATISISLKPGFKAIEGCNFTAKITASASLVPQSSYLVPVPGSSVAPAAGTSTMNYIKAITYQEAETSVPTAAYKHLEQIQYFDGLGRPIQTVSVGASPSKLDIIQPVLYDGFGREAIKTLSYVDTKSGNFRTGVTEATVNNYYNGLTPANAGKVNDNRAYTQVTFDNSPLNRPVSQLGPGSDWATNSKSSTINYLTNDVAKPGWKVTGDFSYSSISYPAQSLILTETTDEQGNITREYKDKQGQVVLKESKLGTDWLQTRYIYDDLGLLRCVVPPQANDPNADNLYCYYYRYDSRNRMVEKRIPGAGTTLMIYDLRDRLRCSQNALQAASAEWSFTKYDDLNRPVMTGVLKNQTETQITNAIASNILNETRDNTTGYYGYNNASFPTSAVTQDILSATYYDDYNFIKTGLGSDSLRSVIYDAGNYVFGNANTNPVKGRVTGGMVKVMSAAEDVASIPRNILYSATYYDKYGHVLRSVSENVLKGKDIVSNNYETFTYKLLTSKQQHFKGAEKIAIEKTFEYDHADRLLATRLKLNDNGTETEITLNSMKYNELGELTTKYLHSKETSGSRNFAQKIDYVYNIRGWLTQINDPTLSSDNDLFGMQLSYQKPEDLSSSLSATTKQWAGNISGIKWGAKNDVIRGYGFGYDGLSRMLKASYVDGPSLTLNPDQYNEEITGYDKNGNITGLKRNFEGTQVDNLVYSYLNNEKSNQLKKITDTGTINDNVDDYPGTSTDYAYDANGNMTYDGVKLLNFSYDHVLNLPNKINSNATYMYYHYMANGGKVLKHITAGSKYTWYIGNIVYEEGKLSYIIAEEGRLVAIGSGTDRIFTNEYSLKDHLGNVRVTFTGSNLGTATDIGQTTSYYPFGLVMTQNNANGNSSYSKNKYLYNGKELQNEFFESTKLNLLDYGHRFYDPQIARFVSIDPLAEFFPWMTCYQYASNDPVKNIDLDGLEGICLLGAADLLKLASSDDIPLTEGLSKAGGEVGGKSVESSGTSSGSSKFTPEQLERMNQGRKTETEQLQNRGLEKNNKPQIETDPKTGKDGSTVPDSYENDGQQTVEVKDVKGQGQTKQLRLQKEISNKNGFKPKLIINQGAKITQWVKDNFEIDTYNINSVCPQDNTKKDLTPPLNAKEVQKRKEDEKAREQGFI